MRALRIALICMLMLALPAQSMAALSMQLCAVTRQSGALIQVDPSMAAHHPGAMAQSADASAQRAHHASSTDNASNAGQSSDNGLCSLCAFCVGAVLLSHVWVSSSVPQAVEPILTRLDQFIGFISEPLERPPRLFLV